jgi:hypothetical protein
MVMDVKSPAKGEIQLDVPETLVNKEIAVVDLTGRVVLNQLITNQSMRLDITACLPGIYFVKIGNYARKLSVK